MTGSAILPSHASPVAVFTAIGGVYVAQSVIGGLTMLGLPAVLRTEGLPLDQIGLLYLTVLPWAVKFLWAPYVEHFRLPPVGRNRSNLIVIVGNSLCVAGIILVGLLQPSLLIPVIAVLAVVALVASTVDIACDGYAVEKLARAHHGWGNAAQVGGSYLGSAVGGGLFLVLVDKQGWQFGCFIMAAVILLLGLPFAFGPASREVSMERSHTPSLKVTLTRPEIRLGLVATALFVASQKWGLSMLGPFLVDQGIDLATLGLLNGAGSMFIGLAGALAGGFLVRLYGSSNVMAVVLAIQAILLAAFAWAALGGAVSNAMLIGLAIASSSGVMSIGFVALYAQFMRWSDPRQAGVDFTVFQCVDGIVSIAGGVAAGSLAEHFGHASLFISTSMLCVLIIWPLLRLMRTGP